MGQLTARERLGGISILRRSGFLSWHFLSFFFFFVFTQKGYKSVYYTLLYEPGLPPHLHIPYIHTLHTYIHVLETRKQKHSQPTSPTSDLVTRIWSTRRSRAKEGAQRGLASRAGRLTAVVLLSSNGSWRGIVNATFQSPLLLHHHSQHRTHDREKETLPSHPLPHSRRSYITSQHTSTTHVPESAGTKSTGRSVRSVCL